MDKKAVILLAVVIVVVLVMLSVARRENASSGAPPSQAVVTTGDNQSVTLYTSTLPPGFIVGRGKGTNVGLCDPTLPVKVGWLEAPGRYGPGEYGRMIMSGGMQRFYKIHVPTGYTGEAMPLMMILHGGGGYPDSVRYEAGMDAIADREGFIIVYPAGANKDGFTDRLLTWNDGRPDADGEYSTIDDVAFVRALLDDLKGYFSYDADRVYVAGFSNGAQFANRLAQQLSDRIAAIGAMAGHRGADEYFDAPPRPVSKIQFSGMEDEEAPYYGGEPPDRSGVVKLDFSFNMSPVEETIQSWAEHDGCPAEPLPEERIGKAVKTAYGPCEAGTEVVLWTLEDGGHTWPGENELKCSNLMDLGNINRDISASEELWKFFKTKSMA